MLYNYRQFKQVATLRLALKKDGRNLEPIDLDVIENGSVVVDDKNVLWVGPDEQIPDNFKNNAQSLFFQDHILVPELVDSHTHLIFAGDRANEYAQRLNGVSYEKIAQMGGGILHTMKKTRITTKEELKRLALKRIETISSRGVGTIEIKSGYGLNFEKEYEISILIDEIKKECLTHKIPINIFNTYMAAHAIPSEFDSSSQYLDKVVIPLMNRLVKENIINAVDIFHEKGYFDNHDVEKLFTNAQNLKLPVKTHADEFNDNSGAELACKYHALSADHLLKTSPSGCEILAKSTTVATLLPGTGLFLGKPAANARTLLDAGVKVAIATDFNPGSCHFDNLLFLGSIAAPLYKLNQAELWCAMTLNASHSLGLKNQGAIEKGMRPRFSFFKAPSIDHLTYHWGENFFDLRTTEEHYQRLANK